MLKVNNEIYKYKNSFSSKNLSIFCEQISMLIASGILLHDGIKMMANETKDIKIKAVLQCIADALSKNNSLDYALSITGCFPEYMINLIAIGNETGTLEKTMKSLAYYYDRQAAIKDTVKSAILYPTILMVMMVTVLLFLSTKVLPVFNTVLQSLGSNLSPIANTIMRSGQAFSRFSIVFIALILIATILLIYFTKSNKGQLNIINLIWQSKIFEILSISILASSMSTTLSSGLDTERALELSSSSVANKKIKNNIHKCISMLKNEHTPFIEAIEKSKLFSDLSTNILSTGMATGSLDAAMERVATLYQDRFETTLIKRVSLIEPISVGILSILIGIILISVMFPLLNVMSIIGA